MNRALISIIGTITLSATLAASTKAKNNEPPDLIPKPRNVIMRQGEFYMPRGASITVRKVGQVPDEAFTLLKEALTVSSGMRLAPDTGRWIILDMEKSDLADEGYTLEVRPQKIIIKASNPKGMFYGVQTLLQLLPYGKKATIPCMDIEDKPAFKWRGLMLDCSRTFLKIDFLKRYINAMSAFKMNILHLHLTDDQGWRLEIPKYPKLTEIGSKFEDKYNDNGGFYTQDEIRDLIKYAQDRCITIIPEIEMPGHAVAALKAYPELSCAGGSFEIKPYMLTPGIYDDVMCPGNENTFRFVEDVLSDVIELFPSKYIHIGGDEVPKTKWKLCPQCQQRMKVEGLKNENELQSYFTKRVGAFLNSKGRRLVGWDEIMEGGLPPKATVMSWRSVSAGADALKKGHEVVFAPTSHCYFDYPYEVTDTEKVYSYNPVPDGITEKQAKNILGVQACMWTHMARTEPDIDRQIFPRLIALSEVAWTDSAKRDYADFTTRLKPLLAILDRNKIVSYKEPEPPVYVDELRASFDFNPTTGDVWKSGGKAEITLDPNGGKTPAVIEQGGPEGASGFLNIIPDSLVKGDDPERHLDFARMPFNCDMWIRHEGQKPQQYGSTIFSYGQTGPGGWRIGINSANKLIFSLYGIYDSEAPDSIVPPDNRWHHITVSLMKDRHVSFAVDGKLTNHLELSANCGRPQSTELLIGNDQSRTTPFIGGVALIRISSGEKVE